MIKKLSMIAPVFSLLCSSSLAFASSYSSGSDVHFLGKIVEPSCFVSTNNNQVRLSCGRSQEAKEGANKRGNSPRLTQSFHFFMFEPIFSPV
ncbi:hypothetical protein ACEZEZ_23260, partial [Kluyvera ascorbata]|uniref:hypothetical protein n=1 Tax=Kluyvera ascorbata TaxID=51288 RepID=UPI0035CCD321